MFQCKKVGLDFLQSAKHRYHCEEIIQATPEQLFAVFEDAESWTVWATRFKKWSGHRPSHLL